ncbi:SagB family peptide dehydrogenase [Nocardia brasiliensis]|uniref:SagB family peptide dehydrogenase n=1 Tax=Nocardia brasiliensis TaxID=37326 RepID=UPI0037B6C50F
MDADTGAALTTFLDRSRGPARGPIDWNAAPARYKRYPDAARIELPWGDEAAAPSLIGALLLDMCGITRLMWTPVLDHDGVPTPGAFKVQHGRSAPSGGALYPLEAYVAVRSPEPGLYHYDPAHHCLELLRPGDHRAALAALVSDAPGTLAAAVLVLTARFWRNGFKYGEFGYRLQTQEIGVLAAQATAVAARLGTSVDTRLHFADDQVHELLDLEPRAEAALAMMFVGQDTAATNAPTYRELIAATPAVAAERTLAITEKLPAMAALHADPGVLHKDSTPYPMAVGHKLPLPRVRVAVEAGIAGRSSPADGFRPRAIELIRLAGLIGAVADGWAGFGRGAALYCLVARVDGIAPGMYRYHPGQHILVEITSGITDSIRCHPIVGEAAAVLLPVGDLHAGTGAHWYRTVQADAGVILQRGALAAATLGLAARIYSGETPDFTADLAGTRSALAALLIGVPRAVSTLEQRIHPGR